MKLHPTVIIIACTLLVAGCSRAENTTPVTNSSDTKMTPIRTSDVATSDFIWDLSGIEPYFKVASPPSFDATKNAFVVIIEAIEDGSCGLKPSVPSALFGFESIFIGDNNREIHIAHDIGSATQELAPAEAYIQDAPDRICVEPQRWTAGTQIRLTIACGLDRATRNGIRRIKVSAI